MKSSKPNRRIVFRAPWAALRQVEATFSKYYDDSWANTAVQSLKRRALESRSLGIDPGSGSSAALHRAGSPPA